MPFFAGLAAKHGAKLVWRIAPWALLALGIALAIGWLKISTAQAAVKDAELDAQRTANASLTADLNTIKREREALQRTLERHQLRLADVQSRGSTERVVIREVRRTSQPTDCTHRRVPGRLAAVFVHGNPDTASEGQTVDAAREPARNRADASTRE